MTNTVKNAAMNIIGLSEDGVDTFLGIPYAEPPVGDLRFAPPVAKKPWTTTLDCTKPGNAAVQTPLLVGADTPVSEDCLYLNIWKPSAAKEGDNLPVYFWIHGGGWCYGSGNQALYDGNRFAKEGVIVVTINYRLGGLGFLALDTLMKKYGTAGNWATLDQIMALQWVNDNIAKFGGNPHNITIGGESAGSFSTFALVMSPKTKGLFQKAIMESGAITYILKTKMRLDKAIEIGKQIAAHFGADDSEEGLAKLRKVDAMELWKATELNLADIMEGAPFQTYPVYDGVVLPLNDPYQALKDGNFNKDISVIIGNNHREGPLFVFNNINTLTQEKFNTFVRQVFRPECAQEVIDHYEAVIDHTLVEKAGGMLGMTLIILGATEAQRYLAKAGTPVFAYEFDYVDESGVAQLHASEMTYAFGQKTNMSGTPFTGNDLIVRDTMHGYWVNFIKTGTPNGIGLVEWPTYAEGTKTIMRFDKTNYLIERSDQEALDFLKPRYFNNYTK
ncbi:MAG TPA: carboxylesterase family protein [Methanocorpusculum sp.]|nr:carboxylesterase family protein [Methanocorpusculum sp.]